MEFFAFRYKNRDSEYEDPRRDFLVRALTVGLFAASGTLLSPTAALALGADPRRMPPGRSIYRLRGDVSVDGVSADRDTLIGSDSRIRTGSNSELIFVVGKDAFILRENSLLDLVPLGEDNGGGGGDEAAATIGDRIVGNLRLVSGRLLSVFGARTRDETLSLRTPIATVGIRGTGVYLESDPDRSYVCTCYGMTRLSAIDDPASVEDISASHHDDPRFILPAGPSGQRIEAAPVINHTDMELLLIEELVGRVPPFSVADDGYGAPRSQSY